MSLQLQAQLEFVCNALQRCSNGKGFLTTKMLSDHWSLISPDVRLAPVTPSTLGQVTPVKIPKGIRLDRKDSVYTTSKTRTQVPERFARGDLKHCENCVITLVWRRGWEGKGDKGANDIFDYLNSSNLFKTIAHVAPCLCLQVDTRCNEPKYISDYVH